MIENLVCKLDNSYAAKEPESYMKIAQKLLAQDLPKKILFSGDASLETIETVAKKLFEMIKTEGKTLDYDCEFDANSANAMRKAREAGNIILIEQRRKSTIAHLQQQIESIKSIDVLVLGVILVND